MKKLFALAALVLGLASCQNEPEGFGVVTGGEIDTVVTVSLPEATRSSEQSGLANLAQAAADFDLRYILEVYDVNSDNTRVLREVKNTEVDVKEIAFPVRLIAGRAYKFVVWADFVANNSKDDNYYNTQNGLWKVTVNEDAWTAMTEARDAYTSFVDVTNYSGTQPINLELTRPFGKLRVVTTDIDALRYINALPTAVEFQYAAEVYTSFNALYGEAGDLDSKTFEYDLTNVYGEDLENGKQQTLFADYLFVGAEQTLTTKFHMQVAHAYGAKETEYSFVNDAPIVRNQLTTVIGPILTDANNVEVKIEDKFANEIVDNVVDTTEEFQAALDYATPGTTIYLQPSIKYGVVSIRPVAGAANTIEDCDYLNYRNEMLRKVENLTIVGAEGATVDAIKVVSGHIEGSTGYVVDIKGLTIDSVEFNAAYANPTTQRYYAPLYFNLSFINIDGLTVKNCKLVGDNASMNFVYLYGSGKPSTSTFETAAKNLTITGNEVNGIARLCELRGTENVTITNNIIKNTYIHGILLSKDTYNYSGNVTITDNYADGIKERFVRMAGAGDATVVVKDNTIVNYRGSDADYIKVTDGVNNNANVTVENNIFTTATATTTESLKEALNSNNTEVFVAEGEYTFPASSVKAGQTIVCEEGTVFTGTSSLNINGATVIGATFKNEGGIAVRDTINGTFKDCTFEGHETLRWCYSTAGTTSVFENCVVKTNLRGVHFDGMHGNVIFRNCEINGFNAFGGDGKVTFENCTMGYDQSNYNGLNLYLNTEIVNCHFVYLSGKTNFVDMEEAGKTLTIRNCTATLDGTEANIADFVGGSKLNDCTLVIE